MLFNSVEFLVFFSFVTPLFFILKSYQKIWLLIASCFFYIWYRPIYILILFFVIAIDYYCGLKIQKTKDLEQTSKKFWLLISLVSNGLILGIFKYYNFFAINITGLGHLLGFEFEPHLLTWALPIGLSFHTFQSMAYTIDVYRGKFEAEKSPLVFALYVLFYPQLVAGPIERPEHLIPQFRVTQNWDLGRFEEGLRLVLIGLYKKVLIADQLAPFVNEFYRDFQSQTVLVAWFAVIGFSVQIYCDFSGYSDMARGLAKMMGYDLCLNFNSPYRALSGVDFWRRWHISLSSWFRDYVYISLGGNKKGFILALFNGFIVFLLSGFWHGANWTFVIWGAYHGFWVSLEKWGNHLGLLPIRVSNFIKVWTTFVVVTIGWVFFRAPSYAVAIRVFKKLLDFAGSPIIPTEGQVDLKVIFILLVFLVIQGVGIREDFLSWIDKKSFKMRLVSYYVLILLFIGALFFKETEPQQFIYFQF